MCCYTNCQLDTVELLLGYSTVVMFRDGENNMKKNGNAKNNLGDSHNLPNPVMVSRQIDGLREVLRRMRASQSQSLDVLTHRKLEQIQS